MSRPVPARTLELAAYRDQMVTFAGVDEVGRGAIAGPLVICALIPSRESEPAGLADSKLLSPRQRAHLEPLVTGWAACYGFGQASAEEIDTIGMAAALTLAGRRAVADLDTAPDVVLLDGPHDYIGAPHHVWTAIKADQSEVAVAAASILAKEYRDRLMRALDLKYPGYAFGTNAGYLSPAHLAGLRAQGPCVEHRTSWRYMDDLPQWQHLRRR